MSAPSAGGVGPDHHPLVNGNSNGQTPSKPSSRLTSPLSETPKCNNVGLSPGLRQPGGGFSSLPSSASTSPGLPVSRPSTPMTVLAGSQPVSPYLRATPVVTNNKRTFSSMRCDDDSQSTPSLKNGPMSVENRDSKRPRLNGITSDYLLGDESLTSDNNANNVNVNHRPVAESSAEESIPTTPRLPATPSDVSEISDTRSARRKNRTGKTKNEVQDGLMQRMASIRKSSGKVRTTQELVQEMALRSASPVLANHRVTSIPATSPNHLNEETKTELMNRFLQSQPSEVPSPPSAESTPIPEVSNGPETVEDILARLPPIDTAAVLAEIEAEIVEEDDLEVEGLIPVMPKPKPDTGPEVLHQLHEGRKESFNGNFDHEGDFHEWFEVVSKRTKDDDLLYVLPYCVIE